MKKNRLIFVIALVMAMTLPAQIFAQKKAITIKIASLVPKNTPYGAALEKLASDCNRVANGEVKMIIQYSVATNEEDALRKLNGNQIQAALFTSMGIGLIAPEVMTLSFPFLIRNDAELEAVLASVQSDLEQKINKQGYVMLAWAKSGWVRIFSKKPVQVPSELKAQKLATSEDTPSMNKAFQRMGYTLIPVGLNDTLPALQSGKVDALYQSPVYAGVGQLFGIANNMSPLYVAPFMGGIVMNQTAWRVIPEKYKPQILELFKRAAKDFDRSIAQLEQDSIATMRRNGLKITEISDQQKQEWYNDVEKSTPSLLADNIFDRVLYNKITAVLQNMRK